MVRTRSGVALVVVALVAALVTGVPPTAAQQAQHVGLIAAEVDRLAGASWVTTAAQIALAAFPDGASSVYLARADVVADALAAGALSDGPVVLVPSCGAVPEEVADAIEQLDPDEVVALGGVAAVCEDLLVQAADGRSTGRLAGGSRTETAVAISQRAFPSGAAEVYLASAAESPDAVASGADTRDVLAEVDHPACGATC